MQWSFFISSLILFLWILLTCLPLIYLCDYKKSNDGSLEMNYYSEEFFKGLKRKPIYLIHSFLQNFRKILLWVTVCIDYSYHSNVILGVFTGVETLFCIYLILLKPYQSPIDNCIFILHSFKMNFLTISLFFFNSYEEWPDYYIYLYLSVLIFIPLAIVIIFTSKSFRCIKSMFSTDH